MLFSSINEINAIYPTSRWDDLDSLLNPLQKVERTKLTRYLGTSLLKRLNSEYALICTEEGGITAMQIDDTQSEFTVIDDDGNEYTFSMLTIDILRTCQEVVLYMMLSDNIRILSSSLNRGGGFNSMTADDYDQSNDKQLAELKKETWRNAMSSVENLLLLLEQDAKEDKVYTDLWKESRYYYQQTDLLFTTAEDLNHYLDISDSREQYIALTPVIRNCQDNYLAGRIGDDLLSDIIAGTVEQADGTTSSLPTDGVLNRVLKHLKQALANYIASTSEYAAVRGLKSVNLDAHGNGDMQLALASRLVVNNASVFATYIADNTTLQSIYQTETGTEYGAEETTDDTCTCSQQDTSDEISSRSYSALADFGGLHLN